MITPVQWFYMGNCKVCDELHSIHYRDNDLAGGICDACKHPAMDAEMWLINAGLELPNDQLIWNNP